MLSCHQLTPALVYRVELARRPHLPPPPLPLGVQVGAVHVPCVGQAGHGQHLSPLTLASVVGELRGKKYEEKACFDRMFYYLKTMSMY